MNSRERENPLMKGGERKTKKGTQNRHIGLMLSEAKKKKKKKKREEKRRGEKSTAQRSKR